MKNKANAGAISTIIQSVILFRRTKKWQKEHGTFSNSGVVRSSVALPQGTRPWGRTPEDGGAGGVVPGGVVPGGVVPGGVVPGGVVPGGVVPGGVVPGGVIGPGPDTA